ncbi:MAG: RNA 2',3'-cyclic phosphodiesterase [Nocardioidaceae bacterium]
MRLFVAVRPPDTAVEELESFLAPRHEAASRFRWTDPEQWHLTLAFLGEVADRHLDDLVDRLGRAAARRTPGTAAVVGGGAFPNPARAKVLYAAVEAVRT